MDRHDLGQTDGPMEDALEEAFERTLEEGVQRLHRTRSALLATGFLGGTDVAMGVLAYLAVLSATGNQLLAGLAFSIGFLALLLGRSELFTEGFLVPVITLAAGRARPRQLLRLWGGTLVANLVGGWCVMWLVVLAFPDLHQTLIESGEHFATARVTLETLALAVLAGAVITLMTRMQHGTDSMAAKIAAAVGGAFLLAGLEMFHSVLDSLLIFGALHTGEAPFGYLSWLTWFWWTALANMLGGLGLVTLMRLVRSRDRISEERSAVEAEN